MASSRRRKRYSTNEVIIDISPTNWPHNNPEVALFYRQTGLLTLGEIDESYFSKVLQSFRQNPDVDYELYSPDQMSKKFPNLTMGPTIWGMYDPIAGTVFENHTQKSHFIAN